VANLEPRIRELSRQLLDQTVERGEMDLAADFSIPLAMQVIAGMIGIPLADWTRYKQWSDVILRLSYARSGGEEAEQALRDFTTVTAEMDACLADMIRRRRDTSRDDLLTRRMETEVNGEKLSQAEILGFFQPDL
jgi:cytochrome P450